MPARCMNGPSERQAKSPVNAHHPPGARKRLRAIANTITPSATHEIDATFSSGPFGRLDSQPPVALPHSGWNGFGVSHAPASTPGALLRHNTAGPLHGRPAIGDVIA